MENPDAPEQQRKTPQARFLSSQFCPKYIDSFSLDNSSFTIIDEICRIIVKLFSLVPDGIQGTVTCYSRNLHDNGSSKGNCVIAYIHSR